MNNQETVLLRQILDVLGISGGAGASATEATQLNVLAALADIPAIEINTDAINLNVQDLEVLVSASNALLTIIRDNTVNKLNRIKGSGDYNRTIVYFGTTTNPDTLTHTGTTNIGVETIIETFTYDGSGGIASTDRVINILYS